MLRRPLAALNLGCACLLWACAAARAPAATVEARAIYIRQPGKTASPRGEAAGIVFWMTPDSPSGREQAEAALLARPHHFALEQIGKTFVPHLLVIPAGSTVAFPNHDPFFHNVFSLFDGKRFDLGLYETGATRSVHFDRPGVSFIFCNIHPQMSAVIIALRTPYYGVTDGAGKVKIQGVPAGPYQLHVWSERALPATLAGLSREVVIGSATAGLGEFAIPASRNVLAGHKNLYGRDYDPATPSDGVYTQ